MRKPSLLYASPLPPQQSGIAIYSRWMIEALAEYFDITLYLENYDLEDGYLKRLPVLRHGKDDIEFERFEYKLYHIGNNPWYHSYIYNACLHHPGWVVLHEFVLYYLVVGVYRDSPDFYRKIYQLGGAPAIAALRSLVRAGEDPYRFRRPEKLPLNDELLTSGNRILVHSEFTRRLVKHASPQAQVFKTELAQPHQEAPAKFVRQEFLQSLGIPPEALIAASFGFVAPTKLNDVACRAVQRINRQQRAVPLYYLMVGEGNYVNQYLDDRIRVTGYVSEQEFNQYLAAADLVLNIRYPVMGETSAALLRAFDSGTPCVVTDAGWFSELPDSVALKLDASCPELIEDHLYEALDIFMDCRHPFERMGRASQQYVRKHHSPATIARQYFELITAAVEVLLEPEL